MRRSLQATVLVFVCAFLGNAQGVRVRAVDSGQSYFRVWAALPLIGAGTADDPIRPKYVPSPSEVKARAATSRSGIIAFSYALSDDGKTALVQFVAANRDAFKEILSDNTVTSFANWRATRSAIETAFQKYKKNFQINDVRVAVP